MASKIIEVALQEVGNKEEPKNSNKNKYGKWFGFDGVAWCGEFVSYCYDKGGYPLGNIGFLKGFAGCQSAYAHFKNTGEFVSKDKVKEGDIILFDWNNDGRYDHTGLFIKDNGNGTYDTVEGNTAIGNDSNGGEVMKRTRSWEIPVKFIHPKVLDKAVVNKVPTSIRL